MNRLVIADLIRTPLHAHRKTWIPGQARDDKFPSHWTKQATVKKTVIADLIRNPLHAHRKTWIPGQARDDKSPWH
jgi:hypothetical protein